MMTYGERHGTKTGWRRSKESRIHRYTGTMSKATHYLLAFSGLKFLSLLGCLHWLGSPPSLKTRVAATFEADPTLETP